MFRHMYDALRKEQQEGKAPQWLQVLRRKQTVAEHDDHGGAIVAAPSRSSAATPRSPAQSSTGAGPTRRPRGPPSSASATAARAAEQAPAAAAAPPPVVKFDPSTRLTMRVSKRSSGKGKISEATADIFEPEGARGHNFMMARWPDDWTCELETLTVSAWRGQQTKSQRKGSDNILWQTKIGENKYQAELKQLDKDNPGVVVKVNGGQKCQLAFKIVEKNAAIQHAVKWAKEMAKKAMSGDDAAVWAKAKKRTLEKDHGGGEKAPAMKKPAAAKRPAAAPKQEGEEEEEDEAEEEEDEEEEKEEEAEEEEEEE